MLLRRLEQWDHISFCRLFGCSSSKLAYSASYWLSKTADGPLYLLLVSSLFVLDCADAWPFFQLLLISFAIELPLYLLLKNSIKRARPADVLSAYICAHIVPSDRFSLPSGHTAGAFVIASAVAVFFPAVVWLVLCWAAAIGLSRIMLGVHFPLDVIAGAILGSVCCALAYFLIF